MNSCGAMLERFRFEFLGKDDQAEEYGGVSSEMDTAMDLKEGGCWKSQMDQESSVMP